jgi:hypothetical protein
LLDGAASPRDPGPSCFINLRRWLQPNLTVIGVLLFFKDPEWFR